MNSISRIYASDKAGNASVATVTVLRSAGATTQHVDTVSHIPSSTNGFFATMGTPHTFTDPITSETITVISEATAVDFQGHIDTGNIIIDAIAPGYTDSGSKVGDIVIIRPTTQWADNIGDTLAAAHNDDGTIKNSAIVYNPNIFDHIASGCVLSGTSYGSTLAWSLTAGVVYIGGKLLTVAATTGTVIASKDTYFDLLDPGTGTVATLVNTGGNIVANNAASPALAANSIRLGIIVSGAGSIAAVGSVNQGQETKVLPIASSVPYAVTDSLGNLICPRDPNRKVLGYRQITTVFTTTNSTATQITGLTCPVIVPVNRKVRIFVDGESTSNSTANDGTRTTIWEGTVGSGTQLRQKTQFAPTSSPQMGAFASTGLRTPASSSVTYNIGLHTFGSGTGAMNCSSTSPAYMQVELV